MTSDKLIPGTWNISHSWENMPLALGGRGAWSEQAAPSDPDNNIPRPGTAAWTRNRHFFPYYTRGCAHTRVHGAGITHVCFTRSQGMAGAY